jgi:pyruvate dehydrogenase E2 component (dihydrolipoamide acetyltransferase)
VIVVLEVGAADNSEPIKPEVSAPVSRPSAATTQDKDDGPVASAVGDLRNILPGMDQPRSAAKASSDYFAEQPLAAPATRKLARELGVDLRRVEPTGKGGRVTREDVESAGTGASRSEAGHAQPVVAAAAVAVAPAIAEDSKAPAPVKQHTDRRVPIRGIRKRTAENMARSKRTAAHFTYVDECDATQLIALKDRLTPRAEALGVKLTYLPFIVKAVVRALKVHSALNAVVDDGAQEIVLRSTCDIGIAASTDAGLFVPVLRDAGRLSIIEIAQEIQRFGQVAKSGRFAPEDLGGSSFTVTSLGKLGGLFATPVINYPEVAILGVHEIKRRPVVRGDEIVIGAEMLLSLSFDHRIIDGHVGAAFAQEIIGLLEQPERLLLEG